MMEIRIIESIIHLCSADSDWSNVRDSLLRRIGLYFFLNVMEVTVW